MNTLFEPTFRPTLFEHQAEAIAGTMAELAISDRCKVLMACATGKTRIGPEIAMARGARTVVVYLPSLALVRQTLPDWISAPFDGGMSYLCVCSDKTVARADEAAVTVDDLIAEFHLPTKCVTTQGADVRDFLTLPGFDGVRVVFSTYQSSDVVRDGCPEGFVFDLGLFDEAHRTAGKESAFSAPLLDSHTPIAKRVFMTATPKHFDYRRRNKDGEAKVAFSMDDEAVYGRAAYRLSIRHAIERGLIAGYQVLVSVVDDWMIEADRCTRGGDSESLAHALAIRHAMNEYGIKKVVTFHDSVADARQFAENPFVQTELGATMFHVNGSIPTGERGNIMSQFAAATTAVVSNARCLTEGVDVPEIDMVAFLHPRKSHVDIIQAIGRALRLPRNSNKTTGYILLPLYVRDIENGELERALNEYGYDTIWQVIQALREQDEVVEMALRKAKMGGRGREPLDFIHVMGQAIRLDFLREAISTRCVEVLGESWDEWFGVLERIYRETGSANVRSNLVIEGMLIGVWVGKQRTAYRNHTLSIERIARLESLGMMWETWERGYRCAVAYRQKCGNLNVCDTCVVDGFALGTWILRQRAAHGVGKLTPERVARLELLGMAWKALDEAWDRGYSYAETYCREHGNLAVPKRYLVDGFGLGQWVGVQRKAYQKDKISPERIVRLEAIGMIWCPLDKAWDECFTILERLHREGSDVNATQGVVIDGKEIGSWVSVQRVDYKSGQLSIKRISLLENIGFKWNVPDVNWEKRCAILERLYREGRNIVHGVVIDGIRIGNWLAHQRQAYKAGKLSGERIARLEVIGVKFKTGD